MFKMHVLCHAQIYSIGKILQFHGTKIIHSHNNNKQITLFLHGKICSFQEKVVILQHINVVLS